jgi:tetratricopeptide (TPR) repeat protein
VQTFALILLITWSLVGHAAPYLPNDDAKVLERLPFKATDQAARELRELRASLAANPDDADRAARLARRYFRIAMAEGDPRYIGYAEAALRRWWERTDAPHKVVKMRALLKQYKHDFAGALTDFALAGQGDPSDEEIWSWRAALHIVQANYAEATNDCNMLKRHASALGWASCQAWVDGMTGKAGPAYVAMADAYARDADAAPSARLWTLTRMAELAWRRGNVVKAEEHFKQALALGVDDQYLLAAYADFLLDHGRAREVPALLKGWGKSDILLLRLALADKVLHGIDAGPHARTLQSRFDAAALRSDTLHLQEEARFRLHILSDTKRALALARQNWALQKEPRDARILLEAALAARDPAAGTPVTDWLASTRHEDPILHRLAQNLAALPK